MKFFRYNPSKIYFFANSKVNIFKHKFFLLFINHLKQSYSSVLNIKHEYLSQWKFKCWFAAPYVKVQSILRDLVSIDKNTNHFKFNLFLNKTILQNQLFKLIIFTMNITYIWIDDKLHCWIFFLWRINTRWAVEALYKILHTYNTKRGTLAQ